MNSAFDTAQTNGGDIYITNLRAQWKDISEKSKSPKTVWIALKPHAFDIVASVEPGDMAGMDTEWITDDARFRAKLISGGWPKEKVHFIKKENRFSLGRRFFNSDALVMLAPVVRVKAVQWLKIMLLGAKRNFICNEQGVIFGLDILGRPKRIRSVLEMVVQRRIYKLLTRAMYFFGEVLFPLVNGRPRDGIIEPEKILLLEFGMLGDAVLILPSLDALTARYPKASIDVMCGPWGTELYGKHPGVNVVFPWVPPWFSEATDATALVQVWRLLKAWLWMVRRKYDLAINIRGESNDIVWLYLSGAPMRAGYSMRSKTPLRQEDTAFLLNRLAEYKWEERHAIHQVEHNLGSLSKLGINMRPPDAGWWKINEKDMRAMRERLGDKPYILLHPGSSRQSKCWPLGHFHKLIRLINMKLPDVRIVLTGGKAERETLEGLLEGLGDECAVNLGGETSIHEFGAAVSMAEAVITNETAALHISSAVSTPCVALMSGIPKMYGPYKVPSRVPRLNFPCRMPYLEHCNCPFPAYYCLQKISPEMVLKELISLISEQCPSLLMKNETLL